MASSVMEIHGIGVRSAHFPFLIRFIANYRMPITAVG
jgi:hypothetical protein